MGLASGGSSRRAASSRTSRAGSAGPQARRRLPSQRGSHVVKIAVAGYAEDLAAWLTAAARRRYRDGASRSLDYHLKHMGACQSQKQVKKGRLVRRRLPCAVKTT
jgi:hypothetical protein